MLFACLKVRKANLTKAKNERGRPVTVAPVIDFNKLRHDDTCSPLVSLIQFGPCCHNICFELLNLYPSCLVSVRCFVQKVLTLLQLLLRFLTSNFMS